MAKKVSKSSIKLTFKKKGLQVETHKISLNHLETAIIALEKTYINEMRNQTDNAIKQMFTPTEHEEE